MTTFTEADMTDVDAARQKIIAFQEFLIERFKVYAEMKLDIDVDAVIKQGGGWINVEIVTWERMFDDRFDEIDFYFRDGEQGRGKRHPMPKDFVFSETEDEKDFIEFKRLAKKFDK